VRVERAVLRRCDIDVRDEKARFDCLPGHRQERRKILKQVPLDELVALVELIFGEPIIRVILSDDLQLRGGGQLLFCNPAIYFTADPVRGKALYA
jgi:hypothetical protein